MSFAPPQVPRPDADEREVLLRYIHWQREQVVATADGLSEDEMRWNPTGRLLPILGIINHLTCMETRWIDARYLRQSVPDRSDDEFIVTNDRPGATVLDAYWRRATDTFAAVRAAPSLEIECTGDEGGRGPVHTRLGIDRPVDLRWVLYHILEETAHHAGHADATREMLDGRKMRS